ncbi:hypothetical protein [Patulibacter sp. SYSU D01012]|uniref:hypothetical protein n=1 Tax=Patulibacter sp. SYSU D01012 TaxID=2817381 RepID=UPI001B305AB6|nr:hypothetical protein [Patulibacter sp. SYSU D01012]
MSAAPIHEHQARRRVVRPRLRAVPDPAPRRAPAAAPRRAPGPRRRTDAPLGVRVALLPVRLALVPVRLAALLLGRLTGGRPWLAAILVLGCGVIALHAATLQTNQAIAARETKIGALERRTAALRGEVAELGSPDRVTTYGREAGMVMPDPEGIGYVDAGTVDARRAAQAVAPPAAGWKPAPNVSEQNGDDPEAGAGAATDGTAAPGAGTAPPAAAASPSGATPGATGTAAAGAAGSSSAAAGSSTAAGPSGTSGAASGSAAAGAGAGAGAAGTGSGTPTPGVPAGG